jgi:hypothetical protein
MQKSTPVFPSVPVTFTGQSLVSHAGAAVLTGFMDALGFGALCEDRLGQFVPPGARRQAPVRPAAGFAGGDAGRGR